MKVRFVPKCSKKMVYGVAQNASITLAPKDMSMNILKPSMFTTEDIFVQYVVNY